MAIITFGATDYHVRDRDNTVEVESTFTNGIRLNIHNRISVTLYRSCSWNENWHKFLKTIVGEEVVVKDVLPHYVTGIVTSESSCTANSITLVLESLAHDTRGLI